MPYSVPRRTAKPTKKLTPNAMSAFAGSFSTPMKPNPAIVDPAATMPAITALKHFRLSELSKCFRADLSG